RDVLIQEIIELADKFSKEQDVKLYYSGLPYIRTAVTKMVKTEIMMFILLAMLVCVIILYIFFRSFKVVFFSMLVVGIGVIWVMGTMVLLNFKITMLTGMIPPLLIVIGIPNSIFLLNKYHQEYKKHGNKILALQRVIRKIGNAIFLTNLTTASGFATFIITSSEVLQEFGIVASINIMGVFFLALLLIPIIFSFISPPKEKHIKHLDNKLVGKFINGLVHYTINHRRVIYISTILILVIGFWGITRIKTTGFMVDDIPHDNPIYTDLKFFEKQMNGVMPLEILVDTKKPNGVFKLSTLVKIDKLQKKLSKYPELSKPISFIEVAKFSRQAFYNGNIEKYTLPVDDQEKTWILNYVKSDGDKNSGLVHAYIDSLRQITRISVNVHDIGTTRMKGLTDSIQAEIDTIFNPEKLGIKNKSNQEFSTILTGTSYIFFKGTSYLINNLFISLALAIILISIFMAFMFKSARMVVVSLIPNIIPLILTAAMMGFLGVPIKPSTVLVFSIAFGISVDDTIHFLAKYRQELISTNWDIGKSVINAIRETGISMMYTSIVLFFGFGIFVASSFGGTMALGLLVSFTLFVAMFANLVLLPSLLLSLEKSITIKAFNKEPFIEIFNEEEDIELNDLVIEKDLLIEE
ncbi:MAG: MMPL family transporter, partial [Bacteroidales bacterium]|nr:MMPL family transporter [Bacteroidales bacterium]